MEANIFYVGKCIAFSSQDKAFLELPQIELLFANFMEVTVIPLVDPFIDQMSMTKYNYLKLNLIKAIGSK